MATQGGPAKSVSVQTGGQQQGGAAIPIAVVTDGRAVEGGPAQPIYVVTSGPVQGGPALPVVAAAAGARVAAGPAVPAYVVSGSFGAAPVNTALPAISGSGAVLSASTGTWTNSPISYTYQWYRNGVAIGGETASTYTIGASDIGATLTVTVTATNASGSTSATSAGYTLTYTQKTLATSMADLIAYWPQAESSGAVVTDESGNGRNGTYVNTPTLGQSGIGDGRTAVLYTAASSQYANVYSAGLSAAFGYTEGTISGWFRVRVAGVWTDGQNRNGAEFNAGNVNNRIVPYRTSTNNTLAIRYAANGVVRENTSVALGGSTAWFHMAATWSRSADQFKTYLNGAQYGATLTGLGLWAGALNSANACIAAFSTAPVGLWDGYSAHVALWDTPLSAAQIAALAVVP